MNSDVSLVAFQCLGTGVAFFHLIYKNKIIDHMVQYVDDKTQLLNANCEDIKSIETSERCLPALSVSRFFYYLSALFHASQEGGPSPPPPSSQAGRLQRLHRHCAGIQGYGNIRPMYAETFVHVYPQTNCIHQDGPLSMEDSLLMTALNNAQIWDDLLWISGGSLNRRKCFFYYTSPAIKFPQIQYESSLHPFHLMFPSVRQTLESHMPLNGYTLTWHVVRWG